MVYGDGIRQQSRRRLSASVFEQMIMGYFLLGGPGDNTLIPHPHYRTVDLANLSFKREDGTGEDINHEHLNEFHFAALRVIPEVENPPMWLIDAANLTTDL